MKSEKRVRMFLKGTSLLLLFIVLFTGCVITAENVEKGDIVTVDYVGRLEDGTVFDTSLQEVAENPLVPKNALFTPKKVYFPLKFAVGSGKYLPLFEEAPLGMKVGDKKEIIIPPEEGYGLWSKDNTETVSLEPGYYPVLEAVQKEEFTAKTGLTEFTVNTTVPWGYWQARVYKITPDFVILRNEVSTGRINFNEGSIDVKVESGTISSSLVPPELGTVYNTKRGDAKVIFVNDSEFIVDYNHPLAGKTLIFDIIVESIEKVVG